MKVSSLVFSCITFLINFKLTVVEKKLINVRNTNKYKYRSLNIEMELPIYEEYGHVISCSISNSDLFWNYLSSLGAQIPVPWKRFFSESIQRKLRSRFQISSLKHVLGTCLFNTFLFSFIQLSCPAANMPAYVTAP